MTRIEEFVARRSVTLIVAMSILVVLIAGVLTYSILRGEDTRRIGASPCDVSVLSQECAENFTDRLRICRAHDPCRGVLRSIVQRHEED